MADAEYKRQADGTYTRTTPIAGEQDDRHWAYAKDPTGPLWATVRSIRARQSWRQQSDELALNLFSDMRYVGYRAGTAGISVRDILDSRLGDNVIRSITRAMNSKLARRRSRPFVTTNAGSWEQRNLAENLEKWLVGKLREQKADSVKFPLFRLHAFVFGTGCLRVYVDNESKVCLEVIPTNEMLVDPSEARYGDVEPPNLYILRSVSLRKLRHIYPDKKDILDKLVVGSAADEWTGMVGAWDKETSSDVVPVVEAIHLPSAPGAGDGRRVVAVSQGCLEDDEWKYDDYCCAWMRREVRPAGFWGIGVPEALAQKQIEITHTAEARREMIELLANPYWLVQKGHKLPHHAISTAIGRVMEYTSTGDGARPELIVHNAVPQDIWTHGDKLKASCFEDEGVSQLAAQMLKPAGLNSGKALRAFNEMESELLSDLTASYEDALTRICELMVRAQCEVGKQGKHEVTYVDPTGIERIEWDAKIQRYIDTMVIEILPASSLSATLSGRIEDVFDMRDLGLLTDVEETWDYLDMPDRKRVKRKHLSHRKLLEKVIELQIIKRGQSIQPEPTWDLKLAFELAVKATNELELYEDAPQDRLELLREFSVKCQNLTKLMAPPVPPEQELLNVAASEPDLLAAGAGAIDPATGEPLPGGAVSADALAGTAGLGGLGGPGEPGGPVSPIG